MSLVDVLCDIFSYYIFMFHKSFCKSTAHLSSDFIADVEKLPEMNTVICTGLVMP